MMSKQMRSANNSYEKIVERIKIFDKTPKGDKFGDKDKFIYGEESIL